MSQFKASKYPKDHFDKFYINKFQDNICLTLVGKNKRHLHFKLKDVNRVIRLFNEYKNRHKVDVSIYERLDLYNRRYQPSKNYYLEFFWSAYYFLSIDDQGNNINDHLRIVHKNDVYSFCPTTNEEIDEIIFALTKLI